MNEETKMLVELARENERLKIALETLRIRVIEKTEHGYIYLGDGELKEVLRLAGMPLEEAEEETGEEM